MYLISSRASLAFDSSVPDFSIKFAEIVVCAISRFRSLGRPGKLPPVIFALGVYRPGYLPQEGHRLTQFPDPGPTIMHFFSDVSSSRVSPSFYYSLRVKS